VVCVCVYSGLFSQTHLPDDAAHFFAIHEQSDGERVCMCVLRAMVCVCVYSGLWCVCVCTQGYGVCVCVHTFPMMLPTSLPCMSSLMVSVTLSPPSITPESMMISEASSGSLVTDEKPVGKHTHS
jgi:hypothetical protein